MSRSVLNTLKRIEFVQFGALTPQEILRYAVVEIYRPATKGSDLSGTPYDEHMGALENRKICLTCGHENKECQGHFGYIVLAEPVFNPIFLATVHKILSCICIHCVEPRISTERAKIEGILKQKKHKRLVLFFNKSKKVTTCPHCDKPLPTIDLKDTMSLYYDNKKETEPITAKMVYDILCRISNDTMKLLGFNEDLAENEIFTMEEILIDEDRIHIHQIRPEAFVFTILPVMPPCGRPWVFKDSDKKDDDLTEKYNSILKVSNRLKLLKSPGDLAAKKKGKRRETNSIESDKKKLLGELQMHVWTLIDNHQERARIPSAGRAHKGICDRLTGKDGRIVINVGGKRVDFSGRTVIDGGGIYLEVGEIGLPKYMADILSEPERVTEKNKQVLQELVNNKGATYVIRANLEDGTDDTIRLNVVTKNYTKPFPLQIGDEVARKLRDGDTVIFNRQPTLREESMTGVKIRVIPDLCMRLPEAMTTPLGADFDGDKIFGACPQQVTAI